jgi:polyisoprenoid-binding protein YceI
MKTKNIVAIAISGFVLSSVLAFKIVGSEWKVNSTDAKISFTSGKHTGTISGLDATINFDPSSAKLGTIKASVNVPTITTGTEQLDHHLQTADFFDAANHPTITFTTESIEKNDSGFVATGTLAMRDSVHTIHIPFTFEQKEQTAIMKGTMDIFAGDYGVGKKSDKGSDRVVVSIEIPLMKE